MTAVLPRTRPSAAPSAAPSAPCRTAFPPEPVDRRARYWDAGVAAWRPSPGPR